jgi:hypothetical protein
MKPKTRLRFRFEMDFKKSPDTGGSGLFRFQSPPANRVGDGGAHEASLVLFLPEVLDASGITPKRSLL